MPKDPSATSGASVLQNRDLAVLNVFSAVRFIDTATLSAILTPDPFPNHQRLRLRLPKLERLGLIARPARRLATTAEFALQGEKTGRGRPQDVWALAQKGATLLDLGGDWNRNNGRLRLGAFAHPLAIARIFALLRVAVSRGLIDIDGWQGENVFRDRIAVEGRQLPIVPDATFELAADSQNPFRAFLEVDCGTEPLTRSAFGQSSFLKKCVAYHAYWKRVLRPRGHAGMVVLTVAKTDEHADRLRRTASRVGDGGEVSQLFWFASEADVTIDAPERFLFDEVWRTSSGDLASIFRRPETVHRRSGSAP